MKYELKHLSEFAHILVGFAFKSEGFNVEGKGIKLVRGKNITRLSLRWGSDARWWDDFSIDLKRYLLKANDIVIGMDGSLVGKNYARVNEADLPLLLVQRVACIRAKENVDQNFLWNCISSSVFERYIDSVKTGTSIPHISGKQIGEYLIPNFPYEEQKKIGATLSALDDKIELNQKINENLERQTDALFKSWFIDFEPFSGEIPANWEWLEFSKFLTPSTEKSNNPSLPMFSVTDQGIFPRDEKFKKNLSMTNSKFKVVHQTDLVFGMSREILNWGIMRHPIGGVSSAYNVYQVSDQINTFYLESYMKANYQYFKDLIRPASREGQGIDKNALMQKVILIPPQDVLEKYYHIENALVQTARHVLEESGQLAVIRDTLLPKLMAGEIDLQEV